jgi:nucleoside-diphosphate-sugar epimerase
VQSVSLDVRDKDAVARAVEGAAVVYNCVNPLYTDWPAMLLPMVRGIVDGTGLSGVRLVALDTLYVFGDTRHMSEASPMAPVSKKGELRVRAAEYMLEADARRSARIAIGRAADFFGPGTPLSLFGEQFFRRVLAGRSAPVFGDPDEPHSYAYTPDVATALVALGHDQGAHGVHMLPAQPAEPTRAVAERFARALGLKVRLSAAPTWLLRGLGLFVPMLRELAEMAYQWEQPYVLDDSKFRATYGVTCTPWDEAVAETVRWGRRTFGAAKG